MNVSDAVKTAYKEGSHTKIIGISFPDLNYTVPQDEIYYESMTLEEAIFDGDSFEAVGCIASRFEISIRDSKKNLKGQRIQVVISVTDVPNTYIPLFYGYVDTVDKQAQKKMQKITAYDALYSKGDVEVAEWYNELSFPITLKNLRDSLFNYIGLTQTTIVLPNDDLTINKEYTPNNLKALNVIKSLCQINGCFGIINRTGTFEYRFLSSSVSVEEVNFYRTMDYKDYVVNPVDKLTIRQNADDKGVTVGTGSNRYIIQGNMFTYGLKKAKLRSIANNIYSRLSTIEYIPFDAKNNGYPWIEVGENCKLQYSVYDFDNSTSSQSVYKNVTVLAFKRTLKGIQNIIDEYSAQGQELQRRFISDLSIELDILQQTIDKLSQHMSTELATYRNTSAIKITDGHTATIADIVYEADKGNTIIFHEEADFNVSAKESFANNIYTEEEVVGTVRYYVNGNRVATRLAKEVFKEGNHILSLVQFWQAGEAKKSRLQVKLSIAGGSVTLPKLRAQAYVTVKMGEYSDGHIEVTKMPDKLVYNLGETLDFTGLVISKVYYDDTHPTTEITNLCTYSPEEGSEVTSTNMIEVQVTYVETNEVGEQITYDTSFQLSTQYITDIYVEKQPDKVEYYTGENLELSGIRVTADYIDGTTKDVTESCTYSPADGTEFSTEGSQTINISYTENGITCTTTTSVYVTDLVKKPIPIIDHNDPNKWIDYNSIIDELSYDVIKARLFINATYNHVHRPDTDNYMGVDTQFGPCSSNFSIKCKGSVVLKYKSVVTADSSDRVKWTKLVPIASHGSAYFASGERHTLKYIERNTYRNLSCPEYKISNKSTLTFGDSDSGPNFSLCDMLFKFEMTELPVCGPVDVISSSLTLYRNFDDADRIIVPTHRDDYDRRTFLKFELAPALSEIACSEFNGDVFTPIFNPSYQQPSGAWRIVSGPHEGTSMVYPDVHAHTPSDTSIPVFRSFYSRGYMYFDDYEFISHNDEVNGEHTPGFEILATYLIPVNVLRYMRESQTTIVTENLGLWYDTITVSFSVPITDILYVGNYASAPEWAKTSSLDDVEW